jgi:hypothetical protein
LLTALPVSFGGFSFYPATFFCLKKGKRFFISLIMKKLLEANAYES